MHARNLLFASPLIAALIAGPVNTAQAAAAPAPASAEVQATSNAAPPTCTRNFKGQPRRLCTTGFNDGFSHGVKSCKPTLRSRLTPELQDAVYMHGYNAGFSAGKATC